MRVCLSWLADYVDLSGIDPEDLGRLLTMGIAEVEGVHTDEASGETVLVVDNKSLTHRPDLWGHVGIARELAAILGRPFRHPVADPGPPTADGTDPFGLAVEVWAEDLCPRYTAQVIDGIRVEPSPGWLARRLTAVGMRPIGNVVDLTNFVMLELGQPLHAFDIGKLRGGRIVVRRAEAGESITTLDGIVRALVPDDLLIADAEHGIALAGVMGSADSEIEDGTTTMVLESATFHPVANRRTAARVGLRTEASMRFEKSLDPELPPVAARRFVELLRKVIPTAKVLGRFHDSAPGPRPRLTIPLATSQVARLLGTELPAARIDAILQSLEFQVDRRDTEQAIVTVPTYRATKDVSIPEDLVEELGRVHGYGNIPPAPPAVQMAPQPGNPLRALERQVKLHLTSGLGMDEVMLYAFQSSRGIALFGLETAAFMKLANPLSEESAYLKRSLVPDLLLCLPRNAGLERFRLFEMGRTYLKADPHRKGELPHEERRVAALLWDRTRRDGAAAFLDAKGAVLGLLGRLRLPVPEVVAVDPGALGAEPWAHPGRAASVTIEGKSVGRVAEVHPQVSEALGVPGRAAYFDLDLEALLAARPGRAAFEELPRFPSVTIDVSLVTPVRMAAEAVRADAAAHASPLLRASEVIAVFEGKSLPPGKKSVTLRLVFRADDRTLTESEVLAERDRLVAALAAKGLELRA